MKSDELHESVKSVMPGVRAALEMLVGIPSVSLPGFDQTNTRQAAEAIVGVLTQSGCANAHLVDIPGGNPLIFGDVPGPAGSPTVLLYSHYDVQPPGPEDTWKTSAFTASERGGRLYGRGAADDKSGVVTHVGVLRAFDGKPPCNIKIVMEGEEETDSHLDQYVLDNPSAFQADVIIICDVGNWKLGEPTLTTSLRGLAVCEVEVHTLKGPVHSGMFGGPAPDALVVLIEVLRKLHDDEGNTVVEGLPDGKYDGLDYSEETFRKTAGVLPDVPLTGSGSVSDRLWSSPSATVIGIDCPAVEGAANALIPQARAVVSLRVPPGADAQGALKLLAAHLEKSAPWGIDIKVTPGQAGPAFAAKTDGPAYAAAMKAMAEAYGKDAVMMGQGGSVPLVCNLAEAAPQAEIILWGAEDGECAMHSPNESVDLDELEKVILAEALFLRNLGKG